MKRLILIAIVYAWLVMFVSAYWNFDYDSLCRNLFGWAAYYDSITDSCKCWGDKIIYKGKCTDLDEICEDLYGWGWSYDSSRDLCVKLL